MHFFFLPRRQKAGGDRLEGCFDTFFAVLASRP